MYISCSWYLNSSWDPQSVYCFTTPLLLRLYRGERRRWINSNTSRKLIRLQPRKEIFLSLSGYIIPVLAFSSHGLLACQSLQNDWEILCSIKTDKQKPNLFGREEKKTLTEESKLCKYIHMNTDHSLLNTTVLRTLESIKWHASALSNFSYTKRQWEKLELHFHKGS